MTVVKKLGLYLHIPFCVSKCNYCDFHSAAGDKATMVRFTQALIKHMRENGPMYKHYVVDTVYLGGGTPSYLGAKLLGQILREVKKNFTLSKYVEITCECNPDSMTRGLLRTLRRGGVNRLSIGAQSANDTELARLGRAHSFQQVKDCVAMARKLKFTNLSLDLMYGLPAQSGADFMKSLDEIIALAPEHISCYGLKLEEGTPLYKENPNLPDDDAQAELYLQISSRLAAFGYEHYEISSFAKSGRRSAHNSKYWDLSEYLGLGPSAHSFIDNRRFSFVSDTEAYCKGVEEKGNILEEEDDYFGAARHGEYIMLRLRTADGIDESLFEARFKKPFDPYKERFKPFIQSGHGEQIDHRYRLTTKGFLVSNTIINEVIEDEWTEELL